MTGANIIAGVAAVAVGAIFVFNARRLATLPRELERLCVRHPALRKLLRRPQILKSEKAVHFVTVFWRICGTLWIPGGLSLITNLRSIESAPGKR
jgi:hypothetical protein